MGENFKWQNVQTGGLFCAKNSENSRLPPCARHVPWENAGPYTRGKIFLKMQKSSFFSEKNLL